MRHTMSTVAHARTVDLLLCYPLSMAETNGGTPRWKVTLWVLLLAGLLGAVADALSGANRATKAWGELRQSWEQVFGPEPHVVTTPFAQAGPDVSVGCAETAPSSVSFTVPADAYDIQKNCEWNPAVDVKSKPCSVSQQGQVVTASGSLVGNDRQWTGNCPGGGHGVLRVSGSYKQKVR